MAEPEETMARHESEPQPDVILLDHRADFYASALPEPRDVRLLVEVATAVSRSIGSPAPAAIATSARLGPTSGSPRSPSPTWT
jgi:hypothetical protein